MTEEDLDEPMPVYVRVLAVYESEGYPGVPQTAWHQFIDYEPELRMMTSLVAQYQELDATIETWVEDVPNPIPDPTHLFVSSAVH